MAGLSTWRRGSAIERASPGDLMQLAADGIPTRWHMGALLTLDAAPRMSESEVCATLGRRLGGVPRLRQRLARTPPGCGRPVWIDDPTFDARLHVTSLPCPPPGDERALLDLAAALMARPLSLERPPWSVTVVTGLAGGRAAIVVVFHHVLADGLGGLAVLASLVDGAPAAAPAAPRRPPAPLQLAVDAATARLGAVAQLPAAVRRIREGLAELGVDRSLRAPESSLNRPTGPRRRFGVVRADLAAVLSTARAHGGTVNDVVLTAATGALHTLLARRGESVDTVVVSVPVSGRTSIRPGELGNVVGVIPVALPAAGDAHDRLNAVVALMRARKQAPRGASAALVGPAFRVLAALRLLHRLLDRQRMINTLVTNVRGPPQPLSLLGVTIADAVALTTTAGNITVAFAVLSYAGTLILTIVADPDTCPDLDNLAALLHDALDDLVRRSPGRRPRDTTTP
jgi:diacylglycerol O-acyltransferase / wax synthase